MNTQRRIFLLISLIAAAGVALLVFALLRTSRTPEIALPHTESTTKVLVAENDIVGGTPLTADMFTWQDWPADHIAKNFITGGTEKTLAQHISGTVSRANILKGMPVTDAMLIKTEQSGYLAAALSPGMRALSLPVSIDRAVAGFIRPDNHVDILSADSNDGKPHIKILLSDVRVLAIDQIAENKPDAPPAVKALHTVTLEVTPNDAETLTKAHLTGNLTLTLRPLPGSRDTNGQIRIIRGGPAPDMHDE